MKVLAIISQLLPLVLATLAVCFCVILFRRHHAYGWLLVSAVFLEPFALLLMRLMKGHPLLFYQTKSAGADGVVEVTYKMSFPFFYLIAVAGLFLLVREPQKKNVAGDAA